MFMDMQGPNMLPDCMLAGMALLIIGGTIDSDENDKGKKNDAQAQSGRQIGQRRVGCVVVVVRSSPFCSRAGKLLCIENVALASSLQS